MQSVPTLLVCAVAAGGLAAGAPCTPGLKSSLGAGASWLPRRSRSRASRRQACPAVLLHQVSEHAGPLPHSPGPRGLSSCKELLQRRSSRPAWSEKGWSGRNGWWSPGEGLAPGGVLPGVLAGGRAGKMQEGTAGCEGEWGVAKAGDWLVGGLDLQVPRTQAPTLCGLWKRPKLCVRAHLQEAKRRARHGQGGESAL